MIDFKIELPEGLADESLNTELARKIDEAPERGTRNADGVRKKPRLRINKSSRKVMTETPARARAHAREKEKRFQARIAKGLANIDNRGWQWKKSWDELGVIEIMEVQDGSE